MLEVSNLHMHSVSPRTSPLVTLRGYIDLTRKMMCKCLRIIDLSANASRPNHWPATLKNLVNPEYSLVIQSVAPIADQNQIREQQVGLNSLVHAVCTEGRRAISVRLSHTMSFYEISCPDAGIPIQFQQSILSSALWSIIYGQITYGNAAITGKVQDRSGKQIGELTAKILPAPPTLRRDWPSRVLYVPVPYSQGARVRVESMGPTLDNWERYWFLELCREGMLHAVHKGDLHDPMTAFHLAIQVQGSVLRFNPFGPLAGEPTWGTFLKVIDTLEDFVLKPYVAHDLQFNLVDGHGMQLGVGYLETYKGPNQDPIMLSDQANSTIAFTMNDLDGANSTGGEISSA